MTFGKCTACGVESVRFQSPSWGLPWISGNTCAICFCHYVAMATTRPGCTLRKGIDEDLQAIRAAVTQQLRKEAEPCLKN